MGLIKSGIKYGGLAYAANAIGKGVAAHQDNKMAAPAPSTQYSQQPPPYRSQNPHYDQSGYMHQSWCDATCGRQCNGQKNQ